MAKVKPTPKQAEVLSRLKQKKHPQTIASELGYSSANSVYNHMRRMRDAGITVPDDYERGTKSNGRSSNGARDIDDSAIGKLIEQAHDHYERELAEIRDKAAADAEAVEAEIAEVNARLNVLHDRRDESRSNQARVQEALDRLSPAL